MSKYRYNIKIHLVKDVEDLEHVLNKYGESGIRVTKVERTDNCIYDNGRMKYTVFLEEKIKK